MSNANGNGRHVFEGESKRLEQILEEFESEWQSDQKPVIDNYLSSTDVEPHNLLVELVHTDLEWRLKAGERVRVEVYLEKYAELAKDRGTALRLIAAEYNVRRRHEPGLLLEEYLERFPQFRADLPGSLPGPHARAPESAKPAGADRVGKFQLLEQVGEGAFGTVYRARDTELNRIVAVKLPRADRSISTADAEKFLREARNAAQLSHPSIVPVYEVGHDAAVPYIVSAYIEGVTLADALVRQHLSYTQTATLMAQVAGALDHAHRHGVVHRDLKPSNIMLGKIEGVGNRESGNLSPDSRLQGSTAFVMDFGLARRDDAEIRTTVDGMVLGTPAYMSPEQARGENNRVEGRSDQYALGVILYELLTGEVPFRGAARMVLQQILDEEPRPPRKLDDKIPRDLETIALKCMAKEQSRRYPTAGEVAADLRRYLSGEPIVARPVGRLERAWRWAKRNPRVAGLSATVALLLFIGAVGATVALIIINAKKTEADRNRIEAERSGELARQHLELALDTLHKEVNEIQEQLEDQPALYPLRERLVRQAEMGLQRLAAITPEGTVDTGMMNVHERLGDIFLKLDRAQEARDQYERFLGTVNRLRNSSESSRLPPSAPVVAAAKAGEACLQMEDLSAAGTYCRQAVATAEELLVDNPESLRTARDVAQCRNGLGRVEMQRGDLPSAMECFKRAVELMHRIVNSLPDDIEAKNELAEAYSYLGEARARLGLRAGAREAFEQSVGLYQVVADARPDTARAQQNIAIAYAKLGDIALQFMDLPAAEHAYRQALAQREQVAAQAPKNSLAQAELSTAYGRLGDFFESKRDWMKARELYEKAMPPFEGLAAAYPSNNRLKRDRAIAYLKLAMVNRRLHNDGLAQEFRAKALHELEEISAKSPDNMLAEIDFANGLGLIGHVEMELQDYAAAICHFERGSALMHQLQSAGKLGDQPAWQNLLQLHDQALGVCLREIALSLWPRVAYQTVTVANRPMQAK
jgi:serine/threonine protein kinase/tetratricopeptide (TPR) repeat protein